MLVKFNSSETGELIMFAETAHQLFAAMGKEGTARGTFTAEEMLPAAQKLRMAVERGVANTAGNIGKEEEEGGEQPIALGQRAWPFIEMLERTARRGSKGNIIWESAQPF